MTIIERDGKKFLQLLDGEVELTGQHMQQFQYTYKFLKLWLDKYSHQEWSVKDYPIDAEFFIKADLFFEEMATALQNISLNEKDLTKRLSNINFVCDTLINKDEQELLNPYANHIRAKYLIKGYQNIKLIFNQTKGSTNEEYLLESIASVSATFVDGLIVHRNIKDENKNNLLFCTSLNHRFTSKGWSAKDQSMGGTTDSTSKANRAGIASRDIIISDENNNHISAIEFLRLNSIPIQNKSHYKINKHLTKIFRNEPLGLTTLFILVYCETKSFVKTWIKYLNYIEKIDFNNYKMNELIKHVPMNPERANIKFAKAIHIRESMEINVFHVFINMFP